jgi:ACS family sodium-dependent inorganic phosphate cotransporter
MDNNGMFQLQVAGMVGPAACLLVAVSPALEGNPMGATALVTGAQGLSALTLGAVSVSQLDIAPKHAGTIFGLGNTFATVAGLLSVKLTGELLAATGSWPLVFTITSAHYLVGAVIWFVWVGGEVLPEDDLV